MSDVRVDLEDDVGVVTLDRPDVRNALTPDMLRTLAEAPERLRDDGARALLLRGEGKSFCAGFDLTLCRDDPAGGLMRALLEGLSASATALRVSPLPVVIAAHGAAIAGGAALLGGGDIVVTNRDAKIGYPVLRLGVSPAVSAPFLRRGVGDGACRTRLLDTRLISGDRAHAIGLAHECEPDADSARRRAATIAQDLATKPPGAMAATKRWLNEIESLDDEPPRALNVSRALTGGDEERARLAAMWAAKK